jgi:hypothetical protein
VELSIVFVNHNGAGCLPLTLEALARITRAEDAVVVDPALRTVGLAP